MVFIRKIVIILSMSNIIHVLGMGCPAQTKDLKGAPYFTIKASSETITARIGHFVELKCCMHNADNIIWAKLDRERGQWEVLNISDMDENRVELFNNRQILIFKSVQNEDAGTYRCYPQQNETVFREISRKFSIEVVACDPLARGPYAIAPLPCKNTFCNLGEDLVLPCNAYFGCSDGDDLRIVQWYVSRDEKVNSDWIPVTDFDPRYTVQEYNFGNRTEVRTNLTIRSVREEDTRRRFRCLLASPQIIHGQTDLIVKLLPSKSEDDDGVNLDLQTASFSTPILVFGASLVVLILIIIVTVWQARKTRKHLTIDMERNLSQDQRSLNYIGKLFESDV